MNEHVYTHPLYEEVLVKNLQRISACSHTISIVREEIIDPVLIERRADLLIAVEDLVNEVMTLALDVRAMTWPDKEAHPSNQNPNPTTN
jgi:hypothetical protein